MDSGRFILLCVSAFYSCYPSSVCCEPAPGLPFNNTVPGVQIGEAAVPKRRCSYDGPPEYLLPDPFDVRKIGVWLTYDSVNRVETDTGTSDRLMAWEIARITSSSGARERSTECSLPTDEDRSAGEFDLDLALKSSTALVIDQERWQLLYAKNPRTQRPIASITKLMTAMVVLDGQLRMDEVIRIQPSDIDRLKSSGSRLQVGTPLRRDELLKLALMASENRAASALSRTYPGGLTAFVRAMNHKAQQLGMHDSHFVDPTGLNPANVSTGLDLALLVKAAYQYPAIREATTTREDRVAMVRGRRMRKLTFHNSNRLVSSGEWDIGLSKTGYIREAGRCLVMQSTIDSKPVIIVLLDSMKKTTRISDANFIRQWLSGVNDRVQQSTRSYLDRGN